MTEQVIKSEPYVLCNLSKEYWRDVSSCMERNCRASTIRMSELLVRTSLTDFNKPELSEDSNHFSGFQNRMCAHCSGDLHGLDTNELSFKVWLPILEQHLNHFLKVLV